MSRSTVNVMRSGTTEHYEVFVGQTPVLLVTIFTYVVAAAILVILQ